MNLDRLSPTLLACALAFGGAAAHAQAPAPDTGRAQRMQDELQKRFAGADATGDGRLTKGEAKGKIQFVYKHFDEIDAAHGGSVTLADIGAFLRTQRAAHKAAP